MTDKLTPEERKQMHESRSWSCAPEPGERSQAGDAVPCPRCHRGAVMHNSKKPCVSCQLKAANTRIAELEKALWAFANCGNWHYHTKGSVVYQEWRADEERYGPDAGHCNVVSVC